MLSRQQAIDPAGPRHQGLSPRITEKTFNLAGPVATQRVNRSKLRSRAPPLLHPWPRPSFASSALAATPPVGLRSVLVVVPRAGFNFSLNTFSHLEQHRQIRHRSAIIPTIHSFLPGPGCSIITPLSNIDIDNPNAHFETIKQKYHPPVPIPLSNCAFSNPQPFLETGTTFMLHAYYFTTSLRTNSLT